MKMNVMNRSFGARGRVLNKQMNKNKNNRKGDENECDERLFWGEESWIK
jgi:hypothetical protein